MCQHNYREQLDKLWTLKIDSNSLNNSISDRCQKHDQYVAIAFAMEKPEWRGYPNG